MVLYHRLKIDADFRLGNARPSCCLYKNLQQGGHAIQCGLEKDGETAAAQGVRDQLARPGFRSDDYYLEPVLSDALPDDAWTGRTGFVHRAVMQDLPDLSGFQVYACGAPAMVDAARKDFTTLCGLPEEEFFADAFTSEADLVKG